MLWCRKYVDTASLFSDAILATQSVKACLTNVSSVCANFNCFVNIVKLIAWVLDPIV